MLEKHLLEKWQGVFEKNSSVPESDYDRACGINDYVGLVSIDAGFGVILGEEPFLTTWLPLSQANGGLLVRWDFADNEASVIEALTGFPDLQEVRWESTGIEIQFFGNKLYLFDAAYGRGQIDEWLEIEMPAGRYEAQTVHYKPNDQTSLRLHRFEAR